jgi:hypothetical protein
MKLHGSRACITATPMPGASLRRERRVVRHLAFCNEAGAPMPVSCSCRLLARDTRSPAGYTPCLERTAGIRRSHESA